MGLNKAKQKSEIFENTFVIMTDPKGPPSGPS